MDWDNGRTWVNDNDDKDDNDDDGADEIKNKVK